jgi:NAD(P)-dependent dehydrogenase (short-subunit alcohol dehydrogenase family)
MSQNSLDRAIVVTGASTGIGRAAVASAVANGAHVFASVRKQADADGLAQEFGEAVTPLLFDVADEAAVRAGAAQVQQALGNRRLFGLVNNAGIAVDGPLLYLESDDLRRQFETNVIGVHNATRAFAPLLGADPDRIGNPGRIVMISSVGGKFGSPFVGAYSASKFAIEGYSQSLRREFTVFGIDVIVIGPGAIKTPIWGKADEGQITRLSNTPYGKASRAVYDYMMNAGRNGLEPSDVGDLVWHALSTEKPKVRYEILRRPFMDAQLPRLLPPRMVDRTIAQRLGLQRKP